MHRHAPGRAARMRTFAPLAALAAGLAVPVALHWLVTPRTSAAGAAGGTVTETITSTHRTGR